jgi:hypothetical protein
MTATCPNGHTSNAEDYCDVCGAPVVAAAAGSADADQSAPPDPPAAPDVPDVPAPPVAAGQECPDCATHNSADALFCEACGYDFTTRTSARGATPPAAADQPAADQPAPPAAPNLVWVAEVWIDPDWYAAQQATDPIPSPGLPRVLPLRKTSLLIGRASVSRNIAPDIDCALDSAASRRQSQLTTDGTRWFVEDLQSANGTFVGPATGALPDDPIPVGPKHELDPDDRVYVGAWTRIVIRKATPEEQASL